MNFTKKTEYSHPYFQSASATPDFGMGLVTDCNPAGFTVDVQLENGSSLTGVPIMNVYGTAFGSDLTWINNYRGATVAVIKLGGQHYIMGTMPGQYANYYDAAARSKVESGEEEAIQSPYSQDVHLGGFGGNDKATYQKAAPRDYHSGRPTDVLPGDKVLSNDVGTSVGIFREGIVRLKASPLAQILLGKYQDFCRVVARRFQGYFDFGEVNITSDGNGKTALQILGGAVQSETNPKDSKWSIQIHMGNYDADEKTDMSQDSEVKPPDAESSRFYIRVSDPADTSGKKYAGIMIDSIGGITMQTGVDHSEYNVGNRTIQVGETELRMVKNRMLEVDEDEGISVMGDSAKTVNGGWVDNCADMRSISAIGAITITSTSAITIKAPEVNIIRG
jgi:hypothetical protein